jgi:signal peptidase I
MNDRLPNLLKQAPLWEGPTLPPLRMAQPTIPPIPRYWWLHGNPPPPAQPVSTSPPQGSWLRQVCLWVWVSLLSLLSYYLISRYVITAVEVRGRSMLPTLEDGQRYFLNRFIYLLRQPLRGDLVVIQDPGHSDRAVKRIIGLPGDLVHIHDGSVYINGQRLAEPYLAAGTRTEPGQGQSGPIRLAPEMYFVLGDNRACSEDSRHYGPIHRERIIGLIPK